jgi:hypothetical protein
MFAGVDREPVGAGALRARSYEFGAGTLQTEPTTAGDLTSKTASVLGAF